MVSLRSIALLGARSSVFSKDTVAISDFLFRPSVCRTGKSWGLNSELSGAMHGKRCVQAVRGSIFRTSDGAT